MGAIAVIRTKKELRVEEGGWLQDTGSTIYGTNGTNLGRTLRKPYDASDYGITGSKFGPWTPKPGAARDRIPWLNNHYP